MTPQWSPDDPGAGSFDGIRSRRSRLADQHDHAEQMQQVMARAASECSHFWGGAACTDWAIKARENAARWGRLQTWAADDGAALDRYSVDVEAVAFAAARQKAVLSDAAHDLARAALAPGVSERANALLGVANPPVDPIVADASAAAASAHRAMAGLAAEREAADRRAAAAARDDRESYLGIKPPLMPAGLDASELARLPAQHLLVLLATLTPHDLSDLAGADPALATRLAGADPEMVASWWGSLDADRKDSLTVNGAVFVGNLEGVDYTHRDRANRAVLEAEQRRLAGERQMLEERREWLVLHTDGPMAQSPAWAETTSRLAAIADEQAALRAVTSVLRAGTVSAPRQLVSLSDLSSHPKAALSVGNLDTADRITYVVPGMGTTVAGSLGSYVRGALNLRAEQRNVLEKRQSKETVATVAWLGYEAPGPADVSGVLGNSKARDGGVLLAKSLEGVKASRRWRQDPTRLSVVGHSYGSTTSSEAIKSTSVGTFILLGSAGVPLDVDGVSALRVPPGQVFASQGIRDEWASIGQAFGFRQDPRQASFGATSFSSEVSHGENEAYKGVTAHGPLIDKGEGTGQSYLDPGTTALRNTALASLGFGSEAVR